MIDPLPPADRIRPWSEDPRYWQYRGGPVLLIGGSREDNLFQIPDLEAELDKLAAAGGNFIRNTMSDRDAGDAYAWLRLTDGRYDLEQWNSAYWRRVDELLRLTRERDVVVQIEVWDRFDLTDAKELGGWQRHPLNPANNRNWSFEETGFADTYPEHPSKDGHPFYHSVPGMVGYDPRLDRVRAVQEAWLEELLKRTLPAGNVLYCMNNETSTDPAWGAHWMAFIRARAAAAGVEVFCTDMFDDGFRPESSAGVAQALADPQSYDFIDISQVNSRNFGTDHWRRIRWVCERAHATRRPVNHTKIYSDGRLGWGSGTPQEGLARFWRDLLAGSAAARFHRPSAGIGSSPLALHCLRAVRLVEQQVRLWQLQPSDDLLATEDDAAYAAETTDGRAVIYLTRGTDIAMARGRACRCTWIAPTVGAVIGEETIAADDAVLRPPLSGPMVAVCSPV